jgi:mannose-6-phosphate isomerase-like protein (cupin superfamily)
MSPRIFDGPELVKRVDATRFLWGDETSHFVSDLIYGRGTRIAAMIYSLRPGEHFGASEMWKPLYDQHRVYFVARGSLTIQDPESGEVAVAGAGEAITWRGAKYHFGYNFGTEETIVLDWYAPQERGPDEAELPLSRKKRDLGDIVDGREHLLKHWPDALQKTRGADLESGAIIRVSPADALHFVHGKQSPMLVSILASSDDLTAGTLSLRPGLMSEPEEHPGDEVVFSLGGCLHVFLPDTGDWFELDPYDCVYLPEGVRHQYCSYGEHVSHAAFCVVPHYR